MNSSSAKSLAVRLYSAWEKRDVDFIEGPVPSDFEAFMKLVGPTLDEAVQREFHVKSGGPCWLREPPECTVRVKEILNGG